MKFTIFTHPQRSPEWFAARAGRLTGSMAAVLTARGKGNAESVGRRDYRLQLALERMTGLPEDGNGYVNDAMQRGIDLEPVAFAAYEAATGFMVRSTGFISSDDVLVGCSLDGDIENFDGIIELKCPKSSTHLNYLRAPSTLLDAYTPQVIHNLWVTGAKYCDLVSFDDRLPKALRMCKVRIGRDESAIQAYESTAKQFLAEVERELDALQAMAAA